MFLGGGGQCRLKADAADSYLHARSRCRPHGQEHNDEESHSWTSGEQPISREVGILVCVNVPYWPDMQYVYFTADFQNV